jgi:hypothetical protein
MPKQSYRVTEDNVADVVSMMTGIPMRVAQTEAINYLPELSKVKLLVKERLSKLLDRFKGIALD